MNPTRWQQIDELFDEILELPKDHRVEFLSKKCEGDEELKKEVLSLLEAEEKAEKFMENSAMNVMGKAVAYDHPTVIDQNLVGKKIGRYEVEGMLGAGGMGEVYLAYDSVLKRKFALKILPAEFVADDDRLQRFEREAQAVSALNHPNIVTIYDVGNFEDLHFIAAEFIDGKTVRTLIDEGLKLSDTLSIVSQTAEALSAAHQNGIIHRDIKPENIMVRPDGYVKILDFGLAKLAEEKQVTGGNSSLKTQKGMVMGTLAYMSPEQATGEAVDHRTDIWSLGVVLYEMLTGEKPFRSDDKRAAYNAILSHDPQPVSDFNNSIPPSLDSILEKFLEKDREMRYQTASDFRADLKRLKRELDSSPNWSGGERISQRVLRPVQADKSSRRKYFFIGAGALSLILLSLLGWFLFLRDKPPNVPDWSKAQRIQLTEHSKREFFPSLSPDGKFFVYAGEADGDFDIYRQKSAAGAKPDNLTENSPASDTQPAFSPNGEFIAFRSEREQKGIYIMGETGENLRRAADFGFHPSWSPDNQEIVVSTQETEATNVKNYEPSQLWIINVSTGDKRLLIDKMNAIQPAWSPNGKQIAFWFTTPGSNKRDVAVIPADVGGEPVIVTRDEKQNVLNWNPVWSPDGNFLYFVSNRDGNVSFWRVKINQTTGAVLSEPEIALAPSKHINQIAFSADGAKMVYVESESKMNIGAIGFDAKNEKVVGEPFWITSGDRRLSRPEISPDGNFFVSRLLRRGQEDIVKVNRQTGEMIDITNDKAVEKYARWSPDGQKISFTSNRSGSFEIWMVDAGGSNFEQITFNNGKEISMPNWSPDGKQMTYRLDGKNFLLNLQENRSEQKSVELPPTPENTDFLIWDWSPDGNYLIGTFMGKNLKGLGYYSFKNQTYEKISDAAEIPMWLSDSRRISYTRQNKTFLLDIFTRKEKEIAFLQSEEISTASVSRANDLLYYTVSSAESDVWLLDASGNFAHSKKE